MYRQRPVIFTPPVSANFNAEHKGKDDKAMVLHQARNEKETFGYKWIVARLS